MIKVKKRKILLLPGDGIGPEVIAEVKKIINWFNDKKSLDFEIDQDLAGGCSYDKHGTPITDEVFLKILDYPTLGHQPHQASPLHFLKLYKILHQ